jgi:hypothetical protein
VVDLAVGDRALSPAEAAREIVKAVGALGFLVTGAAMAEVI